jgi:small multidrug resistance pump
VPVIAVLAAIAAEVVGTLALRGSAGLTRLFPSLAVIGGYGCAFALLAYALRTLPVGPVYAVWSGLGTVGATAGGALLFGERLTPTALVGISLIILGVIVINLSGPAAHR